MKKNTILYCLLSLLTFNLISCDQNEGKGREAMEEMEHEADEAGDEIKDAAEEIRD
jgi:hypothetical protein